MTVDDVLQGGRDKEVLLPKPQLPAGRRLVARIEEFRNRFGARQFRHGAKMITAIECIQLQRVDRARRPKPQRIDVPSAPADDRRIEGDGLDRLARNPFDLLGAVRTIDAQDVAAVVNVVDDVGAFELPRVARLQPLLGKLLLPAIGHELPEQAVFVANAVTLRRNGKARHAVHEAGREPSKAAIAERGIGLVLGDVAQVDAEVAQRGVELAHHLHVAERIAEQPPDQELERQVIDALFSRAPRGALGLQPAVHDLIAQRQRRGDVPVVLRGALGFLADHQRDLRQHRAADLGDVVVRRLGRSLPKQKLPNRHRSRAPRFRRAQASDGTRSVPMFLVSRAPCGNTATG